jgi:predicted MFS family arabinose efflux permease
VSLLDRIAAGLSPRVWLVQAGGGVNAFGTGVVFPFLVIYLHHVRGISYAAAGVALALGAAVAFMAGLGAGSVVDRVGGRNTLAAGLLMQAAAYALFPLIREPWEAVALLALAGAGTAAFWPGQSTLLARLTRPDQRHTVFALQRVTMNLGMGLGAIVGGLIASTADPDTFTFLFLLDAATFLAYAVTLVFVHEPRSHLHEERAQGSYREVVRNRPFVGLVALNVVFVAFGFEMFALLPPYAKNVAGVSERWIGMIWLANTVFIVLTQMPASRLLEGRRRMAALALMNVVWACAALIVLAGGLFFTATAAALVFVFATVVFGVGEVLQGPVQGALVADLSVERLRGRYFALSSMSWSLGSVLGPAVGGPVLGWHPSLVWPLGAAVCLLAAGGCLALERRLPAGVRRTTETGATEPLPAAA